MWHLPMGTGKKLGSSVCWYHCSDLVILSIVDMDMKLVLRSLRMDID
jgi:hypothetical protein